MTDEDRTQIQRALDNHEKLKSSYFWANLGNASSRRNDEKRYTFSVKVEHQGDVYTYDSNVRISTKNFYYVGTFRKNGTKGDVRIFKKLMGGWKTERIDSKDPAAAGRRAAKANNE